ERIVQTTVGLDTARGDRIEVVNMRFQDPVAVPQETGLMAAPLLQSLPQTIGKFLLFGLVVFMAFRLKNALGRMMGQVYVPQGAQAPSAEAEKTDILETDKSVVTLENKLKEVREFAGANPQDIADLVQAWVGESESMASSK
ncbi:hypothetical protein KKG45_07345, partial [bacterium]|nr:hypothetical protein [bacterium]